jgi:uncharacterized membrane protein YqaE (UPF0057 family)
MSQIAIQWVPILVFLLLFAGVVIAEVQWLIRKRWATPGRAVAYALVSDLLGFGIGSLIILIVLLIGLMLTFGPAGTGSNAPESAYWAALIAAIILPPISLFLTKRLFLLIFKIQPEKSAWGYSLVSSILIILVVLVPPPVVFYVLGSAFSWK